MKNQKISFISTRGRGLTRNLHLFRHELLQHSNDYTFEYYIGDFVAAKKQATGEEELIDPQMLPDQEEMAPHISLKQMAKERNTFAREAEVLFAIDASLAVKPGLYDERKKRILLMEPYDFIFKHARAYEHGHLHVSHISKNFSPFTDVVAYSPFLKELGEKVYVTEGTYYDDIQIPYLESLNNPEHCGEIRRELEEIYPQIKGKKLLTLLTSGANQTGLGTSFQNVDLMKLAERMPEDWMIVTNNPTIVNKMSDLGISYRDHFLFTSSQVVPTYKLLYVTEILVSDASINLCSFAATGRPFYAVEYKSTAFAGYMKECYPSIFLKNCEELAILPQKEIVPEHREFVAKFTPHAARTLMQALIE